MTLDGAVTMNQKVSGLGNVNLESKVIQKFAYVASQIELLKMTEPVYSFQHSIDTHHNYEQKKSALFLSSCCILMREEEIPQKLATY